MRQRGIAISHAHDQPEHDFTLCGWRVRSALPLSPDLRPWAGGDSPVEVTIRLGRVVDLDQVVDSTPFLQVGDDGACLLTVASVASFLIRSGNEIVVEPRIDPASAAVRTFLLGAVLGLLCHQRGLFPLQAACVGLGGKAVVLAGLSGTGKSTLAACLAGRGHPLLGDDVCVIDTAAAGGPVVRPAFPRVKLWREALEALGVAPEGLAENRAGQEKYHLAFSAPTGFIADPLPVRAVLLLAEPPPSGPEALRLLSEADAARALGDLVYRRDPALRMGREAALGRDAAILAGAVPVIRFERRMGLGTLAAQADVLEGLAR
jgi:hypothetical protein